MTPSVLYRCVCVSSVSLSLSVGCNLSDFHVSEFTFLMSKIQTGLYIELRTFDGDVLNTAQSQTTVPLVKCNLLLY